MDSLTHIVLGGSIAAAIAPAKWRRQALLMGAAFGSLPDIDVPILAAFCRDPVTRMTWHRGPAHALGTLAIVGPLLWWLLRRRWAPVAEAPWRWFCALMPALFSHPLIDALTVYGTQLWWPATVSPTMWATLFIVDPMVLLPLSVGAVAAWILRERPRATTWVAAGLVVGLGYVGWSILAKQLVERAIDESLAGTPLAHARRFSVPEPFNTLLWRVVVMTPDGYLEGERSLVADHGPIRFRRYRADAGLYAQAARVPDGARLQWFASGFDKATVRGDELVLTDLRMGSEPDYFFSDAIARRVDGQWVPILPHRVDSSLPDGGSLVKLWHRTWHEPASTGQNILR